MKDSEIISRFLETEDPDLFRELVERYEQKVFRLVLSVLGPFSEGDAEDITQDIFIKVFQKADQWKRTAKFSTWLYRIAYNTALNRKKSARFRFPHVQIKEEMKIGNEQNLFDNVTQIKRRKQLAECLEKLPSLYKFTIYSHYWLGSSVTEISEYLDVPQNTTKSYLFRGRKLVHDLLAKQGVTEFE